MQKRYIAIIILLIFFLTPYFTFGQSTNAGFIPGNIWYSIDPFNEGDNVKIYTLIYNPDKRELSGTVFFFDKTTFLGSKNFTVPGNGVKDVFIEWEANVGDHLIFGQIQNAKFLNINNTYEEVVLSGVKTIESSRKVIKKEIPKNITVSPSEKISTSNLNIIPDVQNFVKENTPDFVSSAIDKASVATNISTNKVEDFRKNIGTIAENKKIEVKKEVAKLDDAKIVNKTALNPKSTTENKDQNKLIKPFKYTELFALSLFSTAFNNKFIFYGLIVLIIFIIVRFSIRRFF